MKKFTHRHWYAAAASLGVLAIGLTWVLPNLSSVEKDLTTATLAAGSAQEASRSPAVLDNSSATATGARSPAEETAESELPAGSEPPLQAADPEPPARVAEPAPEATGLRAQIQRHGDALEQERMKVEAAERQSRAAARSAEAKAIAPAAPPPPSAAEGETQEVTVTGARARLQQSVQVKREATTVVDAISSEDIARLPRDAANEGRDRFEHFENNPLHQVADEPVSTFSADVDTASYSFVRAELNDGLLPEKDAVRAEEMINYFDYAWPAADSRSAPFKPTIVVSDSPWNQGRKLVHIGIKGYEVDRDRAPDANLVLLLDVSGSMDEPDKLPLVIRSMEMLLGSLKPSDTVGIVVYAGAAGTVLEPTPVREKSRIIEALRSLEPGGSTAGAEGIELAYRLAESHFRKGGVNRILLCTDGDFNVGIDSTEALKSFVERKRAKGVYLSVLGFGQGNYRDELAQALAQNGNGVAAYIDTEREARKVLVQEAGASLFTIAKDVKLQVEFNPATVSEYRLVGYETRALRREDFNNDAVDAGDVGAGHTVTAIYEVTPVGAETPSVDEPRYPENRVERRRTESRGSRSELGFLKIRYKLPGERTSRLMSEPIPLRTASTTAAVKRDVQFSTAVAGFAQLLRGGQHTGPLTYGDVLEQAQSSRGEDRFGHRAEFIELVRRAQELARD